MVILFTSQNRGTNRTVNCPQRKYYDSWSVAGTSLMELLKSIISFVCSKEQNDGMTCYEQSYGCLLDCLCTADVTPPPPRYAGARFYSTPNNILVRNPRFTKVAVKWTMEIETKCVSENSEKL